MRRFRGPHMLPLLDMAVADDRGGASLLLGHAPTHDEEGLRAGKMVYMVLPYYRRGNLQDAIHEHLVRGTRFDEAEMMRLFLGTCEAVRMMHEYRLPKVGVAGGDEAAEDTPASADSALLFDIGEDKSSEDAYPPPATMQRPSASAAGAPAGEGPLVPYAHRDLKPAYVEVG